MREYYKVNERLTEDQMLAGLVANRANIDITHKDDARRKKTLEGLRDLFPGQKIMYHVCRHDENGKCDPDVEITL